MSGPTIRAGADVIFASQEFAAQVGMDDQLKPVPAMAKAWLSVPNVWVEASLPNSAWMAAFRIGMQGGLLTVTELRVYPHEDYSARQAGEWSASHKGTSAPVPPGGLKAAIVAKVRWSAVNRHLRAVLETIQANRELAKLWRDHLKLDPDIVRPPTKPVKKQDRRGRPKKPDLPFAKISAYYCGRCEIGSRSPVSDCARHFRITTKEARTQLHQARRRGLLAGGGKDRQGIAGGRLTEEALRLLGRKK